MGVVVAAVFFFRIGGQAGVILFPDAALFDFVPDGHQGGAKARAEARFKRISAAYQALSAPGGGERRARASGGEGRGGGAEDFARRARAANARRGGETPGGYGYEYRRDFTREDAERVFREMFGNDSSSFTKRMHIRSIRFFFCWAKP